MSFNDKSRIGCICDQLNECELDLKNAIINDSILQETITNSTTNSER